MSRRKRRGRIRFRRPAAEPTPTDPKEMAVTMTLDPPTTAAPDAPAPREIGGVAVVADRRAATGGKHPKTGEPLRLKQVRDLLLADGTHIYGCAHCDYTNTNLHSMRPHLNKHRDRKAATALNGAAGISLADVIARLGAGAALEADRDRWRDRALAAERDLGSLRRAFERAGLITRGGV